MKKLTFKDFEAMTIKEKTALVKLHLGLDVGDGWRICGHDYNSIIVGRNFNRVTSVGGGWRILSEEEVILSNHKYYLYDTTAAIDAINKKNSTSKTD